MSNEHIARNLLVEIKGETFEFTPLNLADITGPVTDYLKLEPVASLLKQRDAFDEDVFEELLSDTKEKAEGIELGTSAFSNNLVKPKNLFYMFWLSLRKKHPQIKKNEFDKIIQEDTEAAKTLLENLNRILAFVETTPKDEQKEEEGTRIDNGTKKKTNPST